MGCSSLGPRVGCSSLGPYGENVFISGVSLCLMAVRQYLMEMYWPVRLIVGNLWVLLLQGVIHLLSITISSQSLAARRYFFCVCLLKLAWYCAY